MWLRTNNNLGLTRLDSVERFLVQGSGSSWRITAYVNGTAEDLTLPPFATNTEALDYLASMLVQPAATF